MCEKYNANFDALFCPVLPSLPYCLSCENQEDFKERPCPEVAHKRRNLFLRFNQQYLHHKLGLNTFGNEVDADKRIILNHILNNFDIEDINEISIEYAEYRSMPYYDVKVDDRFEK